MLSQHPFILDDIEAIRGEVAFAGEGNQMTPTNAMRILSKSKLIAFRQCPKRLWLELHRPELRQDSAGTLASFQVGHQVGDVAKRIYDPNGTGAAIDVKGEGYEAAFARSTKLLAESEQPIFEAGFKALGALAFADVMLPVGEKGSPTWRMVEVKSSTSVKDYHRDDVAVQTFIAQEAGVKLESIAVACIDSSWVYPGEENYQGLLVETDLTDQALARTAEVRGWLSEAQKVAALATEPNVAVGSHCHEPFDCGFCGYCNRDVVQPEYPVDWLPSLGASKRDQLTAAGVDDLRNVPDNLLNVRQRRVKLHTLDATVYFDAAGAAHDLAGYGLPAYFLDFETIQFAVPIWKGTRPYQQIPFQFSVHTLSVHGKLSQDAFLDLTGNDPSEPFAKALIAACGTTGTIFVYNAGFETARVRELARRYPELSASLLAINNRVVDLLPIARNRYYHPSQQGSWSIKVVLPAAVPELSYSSLDGLKDGGMAMAAFAEAVSPSADQTRKEQIRQQLLAYCRLDTFAMVRLWQVLSGRNCEPLKDVD
jgi:hypothetical protein